MTRQRVIFISILASGAFATDFAFHHRIAKVIASTPNQVVAPTPNFLAGSVWTQDVFVHPATQAGAPSRPAFAPPYGAHFLLKATYDLSHLKPAARVVARSMQTYGMFRADGGNIALTAQSDADTKSKYAIVDYDRRDLQSLKVTGFAVVDGASEFY
jgi:hypothetical protein